MVSAFCYWDSCSLLVHYYEIARGTITNYNLEIMGSISRDKILIRRNPKYPLPRWYKIIPRMLNMDAFPYP